MIFSCHIPVGPCEWQHLRGFVSHFNATHGKSYSRSACLDVGSRNRKEPEVLLEAPGETPIVIERKFVAWPSDYLANHGNEHIFDDLILARLSDKFSDSAYRLAVHERDLKGKKKREVEKIAKQIADIVLVNLNQAKSPRGIGGSEPIHWSLRPLDPRERYENAPEVGLEIDTWGEPEGMIGGGIQKPDEIRNEFLRRQAEAKSGYTQEFERAANNAAPKFAAYAHCLKLLLVQFYGSSSLLVMDEDIIEVVQSARLPGVIDQVWVAQDDWITPDDYEVAWQRVR